MVLAPAIATAAPKETGPEFRKVRLVVRNASDRASAAKFGTIVDDYGTFVIVRLPEQAVAHARAAGLDLELLNENIGIGAYKFDPGHGTPAIPAAFSDKGDGAEPRYYMLQFRGPVRDEWIAGARALGLEFLQYIPDNAYLVRATPAQIAAASRGPEVRWSGLFHPAYKLSDDLAWLLDKPVAKTQAARQYYRVSVFRGQDLGAVTASIERLGGRVDHADDVAGLYFRNLLVEIDTGRLADLAAMRAICRIETWYPDENQDERSDQAVAGNYTGTTVVATGYASFLTGRAVNGSGITVGVVDDGVDATEAHLTGRVTDTATLRHGAAAGANGHGHHDAGIIAGQCTHTDSGGFFLAGGMAPQAHILNIPFLRSGYGGSETEAQSDIVETAAGNGQTGTVSSNSWGSIAVNPNYGSREAAFDALVHDASSATAGLQPLAIVFSAGNSGPGASTITSPQAAKNILVVGASENYRITVSGAAGCGTVNADNIDQIACFSSRGPAADGRIRPDVVAPGTWIVSALAGTDALWGNIDAGHRYCTGTSQACPHVAGATALIQQWWKNTHSGALPAPALSKAMIINGAVDPAADPAGTIPNNSEGWGRMNLANSFNTGVPTIFNNQQNVLTNAGQTFSAGGTVSGPTRPFRVTLVWSDAPGAAGANPALVNNLDLEVTVGGSTYKGNVFASGVSTTGGSADSLNNVESVYFPAGGVSGTFTVTVRATSLGGDGAPGTGDATDQHFALVIFNGTACASPLPPVPSAVVNGNNRIDVSWSAAAGATSYKVFRGTSPGGPYTLAGSPAASPFVDTTVTSFVTYYYVVHSVGGCESGDSAETSATAAGTLAAPAGLTAALVSATSAQIAWSPVVGAVGYHVYRTANNATYGLVGSPAGLSYLDTTASPNTAYLYLVRAVDAAAHESANSNKALVTTVIFTDPGLVASSTRIKAAHIEELRTAVNAVRVLAGLGAAAFTDPALSSSIPIRRAHLIELRGGLDGARVPLGLPALTYTDPAITAGSTKMKTAHVIELRQGTGAYIPPVPAVTQLLLNPGFELGAVNWVQTANVISTNNARTGTWKAWLNGYGTTSTDYVDQQISIPADATAVTFSFWVNITTSEITTTIPYDQLQVQVLDSAGGLLQTLATYSNLNATGTYVQHSFNLLAYQGQTIRVRLYGTEDSSVATSFLIDDTAVDVTQ